MTSAQGMPTYGAAGTYDAAAGLYAGGRAESPGPQYAASGTSSPCDSPLIESAYGGDEHFAQTLEFPSADGPYDAPGMGTKLRDARDAEDILSGLSALAQGKLAALDAAAAALAADASPGLGLGLAGGLQDESFRNSKARELSRELASLERRQSLQGGVSSCPPAVAGSPRQAPAAEPPRSPVVFGNPFASAPDESGGETPRLPTMRLVPGHAYAVPPAYASFGAYGGALPAYAGAPPSPGGVRRYSVAVPSASMAAQHAGALGRAPLQFVIEDPSAGRPAPPGGYVSAVPAHLHALALQYAGHGLAGLPADDDEERDAFAVPGGMAGAELALDHMVAMHEGDVADANARRHSLGAPHLYCCPWSGCGKVFNRFYNLRSHYRIHSGEKPYVCAHCDASFARNHDLKRHERIHSKDRPFVCEICNKSFSRNDALNRHLRLNSCSIHDVPPPPPSMGIPMRRVSSTGVVPSRDL